MSSIATYRLCVPSREGAHGRDVTTVIDTRMLLQHLEGGWEEHVQRRRFGWRTVGQHVPDQGIEGTPAIGTPFELTLVVI